MAAVKQVRSEPTLPALFARAVAVTPLRRSTELPDTEVVRDGVRVDVDALADYDRVCGFGLSNRLPSTYLHVLTFGLQVTLFADRAYPYPLTGSVHLSQRLVQHRPVTLDETVRLSVHAADARRHRRGAMVDLVGRATVGDETVWEGVSTYLYRGQKAPGEVPEREAEPDAPDGPGAIWRLPSDLGRQYARVSGDVNPIHLSGLSAKALGFPGAIAHGMWSMARMLGAVESRLPDAYTAQASFRSPVRLPSTVRFVAQPRDGGLETALRAARKGTEHVRMSVAEGSG